jgi:8-oxo-dGTP pyrophosphatase MutT (NUDIX family)
MEPELSYGRHRMPALPETRAAAVMALFYPHRQRWHLPLTVRPAEMTDHAGQVSFPGGGGEAGETARQCALRELHEELGVPAAELTTLGQLSPIYVYNSDFAVQPVVAVSPDRPHFHPNPGEVSELLEIPAGHLMDPSNYGILTQRRGPLRFTAPCIHFRGHRIWGATAIILSELLGLLETVRRAAGRCGL